MTYVATLIAAPATRLTDDLIARARAALPQTTDIHWLDRDVAVDIEFIPEGPVDQRQLSDHLRAVLAAAPSTSPSSRSLIAARSFWSPTWIPP